MLMNAQTHLQSVKLYAHSYLSISIFYTHRMTLTFLQHILTKQAPCFYISPGGALGGTVPSGLVQKLLGASLCWRALRDTGLQNYLNFFFESPG